MRWICEHKESPTPECIKVADEIELAERCTVRDGVFVGPCGAGMGPVVLSGPELARMFDDASLDE